MRNRKVLIALCSLLLLCLASVSDAKRRSRPVFGSPQIQADKGETVSVVGTFTLDNPTNWVDLQQPNLDPNLPYTTVSAVGEVYTDSEAGTVCVAGYLTVSEDSLTAAEFSVYEVPCS